MEIGATLKLRVPFLIEMHNVPHEQQKQVLFATGDALPRLSGVGIDAGGNGSWIAESAHDRWGSMAVPTRFTEEWYRTQMPRYKAAITVQFGQQGAELVFYPIANVIGAVRFG